MKKKLSLLFVGLVAAVCLASCTIRTHEDWQKMHDQECASRITKFNYEGHSYLLYHYGKEGVAMTHDANCKCYTIPDSDY